MSQMNKTQFKWSNDLKCCKNRKTSTIAFICISSIISAIPVFFYGGFYLYGRRMESSEFLTANGKNYLISL